MLTTWVTWVEVPFDLRAHCGGGGGGVGEVDNGLSVLGVGDFEEHDSVDACPAYLTSCLIYINILKPECAALAFRVDRVTACVKLGRLWKMGMR